MFKTYTYKFYVFLHPSNGVQHKSFSSITLPAMCKTQCTKRIRICNLKSKLPAVKVFFIQFDEKQQNYGVYRKKDLYIIVQNLIKMIFKQINKTITLH